MADEAARRTTMAAAPIPPPSASSDVWLLVRNPIRSEWNDAFNLTSIDKGKFFSQSFPKPWFQDMLLSSGDVNTLNRVVE